jgi:hypothetical protein
VPKVQVAEQILRNQGNGDADRPFWRGIPITNIVYLPFDDVAAWFVEHSGNQD